MVTETLYNNLRRIGFWENIPQELKDIPMWGIATLALIDEKTGKRDKAPRNYRTHAALAVNSDVGWATFDEVVESGPPAIGFRIRDTDPYAVIDLDYRMVTDSTKKAFRQILDACLPSEESKGTYVEYSISTDLNDYETASYHAIFKANGKTNHAKGPIQLFQRNHFIILTGNTLTDAPIAEDTGVVKRLVEVLNPSTDADAEVGIFHDGVEVLRDETILTRMFGSTVPHERDTNITRGAYLRTLYSKDYRTYPPTQDISALELELAHALVFFTQNRDQFYRIFSKSGLYRGNTGGKSGYPSKEAYDNRYLMGYTFGKAIVAWQKNKSQTENYISAVEAAIAKNREEYENHIKSDSRFLERNRAKEPLPPIEKPAGLVGDIAEFFYELSPRPMWESAIASALALIAAYGGRVNNIQDTGLCHYFLVVGGTGKGKETGPRGISVLMRAVNEKVSLGGEFMLGGSLTSGAATHNGMSRPIVASEDEEFSIPSKLLLWSEAGQTLKNICRSDPSENMITLKKTLLDFYSKSSWRAQVESYVYAREKDRMNTISAPNLILLGDMTEGGFESLLTPENILDGFVPRFTVIEHRGSRPPLQLDRNAVAPSNELVTRLVGLVTHCLKKNKDNICTQIVWTDAAKKMYLDFSEEVDEMMNAMENDDSSSIAERELWNRAGLKVLRVAGTLAVGVNHIFPQVDVAEMKWAIDLIRRDVKSMTSHMSNLTTAVYHDQRIEIIMDLIDGYFKMSNDEKLKVGAQPWQISGMVIGSGTLTAMVAKSQMFLNNIASDKSGPRTLDQAIQYSLVSLVQRGFLIAESYSRFEGLHNLATTDSMRTEALYRLNDIRYAEGKKQAKKTIDESSESK